MFSCVSIVVSIKWRRPLFDNEIEMAVSFIQKVEGLRITPLISDHWVWEPDPTGQYSVKSAYNVLRQHVPVEAQGKKQIDLQDYLCPFCRSVEESATHLFFHCRKIIPVWWESLSWVNLVNVFLYHPRQHFIQHVSQIIEGMAASRWKGWWIAMTWTIWKHKNNIVFSNSSFNTNRMME